MDRLAAKVGASKTAAWNRVQRLQRDGAIKRQIAVLDADRIGLPETFFIAIRTNKHNKSRLIKLNAVLQRWPQIVEAHCIAGEVDYLLKVQVASIRQFDELYKNVDSEIDLFSVTSSLSMEVLKLETALPIPDPIV